MFFIWVVIIGLLQITVLRDVNLLVLLAVFSGLRNGPIGGLLRGAAIGLFVEFLASSICGLNLILYSLVGFLCGIAKSNILYYRESIFMDFVFSFCAGALFYFTYFILTNRVQEHIFCSIFFSAIVSPFVFRLVK